MSVFTIIMSMQKERRYIIQGIIVFLIFIGLYTLLDQLNIGYSEMINQYGVLLVASNIILNVIMAFISAFMWNISTALVKLTGKEGKGSFMSGFAVVFGMLTYGCTPCVIAFFSTVGITFAVAVLPLAGLPYKLLALLLLVLGFFWLKYETNHVKCKIKN
jgi:drug/metabolite transporter (DMT)-like permease